jgi:Ca2+-binding RTX toxin-like protein
VSFYSLYWAGTYAADTYNSGDGGGSPYGSYYAAGYGGDDVLIGSGSYQNFQFGGDYFDGGDGNDILRGGSGSDWLLGGNGNDFLYGDYSNSPYSDLNNDFIAPGSGNDYVDGGGHVGIDDLDPYFQSFTNSVFNANMVYYADAQTGRGVVVNLAASGAAGIAYDPWGGTDTLVNIEGVIGTFYADQLSGNAGDNSFIGWEGADVINGAGGSDTVFYNILNPTSTYDPAHPYAHTYDKLFSTPQGVVVNLVTGFARDPYGYYDILISIENVHGTPLADYIQGDNADNQIFGDLMVTEGEEFASIYPDPGTGNDVLLGGGGNDTITALYGNVYIDGGAGNDFIRAGGGDYILGGAGSDTFQLRPAPNGVTGADFIADFSDSEDFLLRPAMNWMGDLTGSPPFYSDNYTLFDYSGSGLTGVFVVFDSFSDGTADHYVFVQNMTSALIADNII